MCYLKCILRCCTEFFFWIFDFRGSFSELENWEFEEKNWKKKLKFFCSDLSFTKNKSFLRQILRQPWNFFFQKSHFWMFSKKENIKKSRKIIRVPPCEKNGSKKIFSHFLHILAWFHTWTVGLDMKTTPSITQKKFLRNH